MAQSENDELNVPARNFFDRKLKCAFSTTEFQFSAGKLDVLAYNRRDRCFHVAEGKLAHRIASVGHAVGQLIAYISMLQESGFDFLNRISKEANLYLTDFVDFLQAKSIKVCFYIVLPEKHRNRILNPALLVLNNVGDFGQAIGILFANKKGCVLEREARPIDVRIRKRYTRAEFLSAVSERFIASNAAKGIEAIPTKYTHLVQFGERDGNGRLHFELAFHRKKKTDLTHSFDTAFHLEWGAAWQRDSATFARANKIRLVMKQARGRLESQQIKTDYQRKWGKAWSRLYMTSHSAGEILDDEELTQAVSGLQSLADALLPLLKKINWGRRRKTNEAEG
jgi:hypothetical protein